MPGFNKLEHLPFDKQHVSKHPKNPHMTVQETDLVPSQSSAILTLKVADWRTWAHTDGSYLVHNGKQGIGTGFHCPSTDSKNSVTYIHYWARARRLSLCCLATFEPFLTWVWGCLIGAGLGLWHYFVLEAKESTEEVVQSLRVQEEQDYKQIRTAALVTTIVLAVFTGFAMIMSIIRTRLALGTKKGEFPHRTSTVYMVLMYPILSVLCLCLVWLVLLLMGVTLWMAALALYDQGVKYFLQSSFEDQLSTLQDQGPVFTSLVQSWDNVKDRAQPAVRSAVNPGVEAVRTVLDASDNQCPEFCVNLANIGNNNENSLFKEGEDGSCLCNFTRFQEGRQYAKRGWQEELPYVLLGLGLAWIGMSLLTIEMSAHISRTWCERTWSSSAHIEAEGATWLSSNKKGALAENKMASYNTNAGSQPAPINPLSWIAGANMDRKQQQGLRSSPTAADADAEAEAVYEHERQQQEQEHLNAAHHGYYNPAFQTSTQPLEQPWEHSLPTATPTYYDQVNYGGYDPSLYSVQEDPPGYAR
ncbi:hypothetical protein DUNSADRAFT_1898 [Dunaliella salina]|uniref:Uncharacterized protein n=1 Tax=Dunaliella salina TaxID=3046 RepID=A0ABQ7GWF8_DUNSA|nr:hypothetical protein DUNSADRAFT_1898 [Dunaliella salina]|eukprot:KAF5838953.1 hypothetical protein DUNSADRAFT_1898 [Dunaliella salina]